MNYRRGLLRLYAILTVIWVGWGLYRPVSTFLVARANMIQSQKDRDCPAEAKKEREDALREYSDSDPEIQRYAEEQVSGLAQDVLRYCQAAKGAALKAENIIGREAPFETALIAYRNTGRRKVALFCLGPPLALLLLGLCVFWITRGFRPPNPSPH